MMAVDVIIIANRNAFIIVGDCDTPVIITADSVFDESIASFIKINPNICLGSSPMISNSFDHKTIMPNIEAMVFGFELLMTFTIIAVVTNRTKPANTSSTITATFKPNFDLTTGIVSNAFAVIRFMPIATIIVRFTFVAGVVSEFTATL
jgi:hypothetical protein